MHDQIAHIIPTHERPAVCQRLVDSTLRQWPEARVYVCDDSRSPSTYDGATDVPAEAYDIGLSAKRNKLVQATEEPFLMLWDDDYIAYDGTSLWPFWAVLHGRDDIGIVGGEWLFADGERGEAERRIWFTGRAWPDGPIRRHRPPKGAPRTIETGHGPIYYHEVDFVPNWFMARRETLELVPWDEQLKLQEHIEFFCRLAAVRAQHDSDERSQAWRDRYRTRAEGNSLHEVNGGSRLVYTLASFRNERHLSDRRGAQVDSGEWVEVPVGYAQTLQEKGLAKPLTAMEDVRPFPLPDNDPPESDDHIPTGVALAPGTTCVHDRDHQSTAAYEQSRSRQKFWSLQHQKLGCSELDLVQWGDYPHDEPDFPEVSDDLLQLA